MPDPGPEHADAARALERFLLADPGQWPRLAPRVVAAVGHERLRGIVAATREHAGEFTGVTDGPDGLVIGGTAGRALAFARADADGNLAHLRISPAPTGPPGCASRRVCAAPWAGPCGACCCRCGSRRAGAPRP